MPNDLTARRRRLRGGGYDWHLACGLHGDRRPTLVLRYEDRPGWPRQVREAGITHVSAVLFPEPEDRVLFAVDCDL